MRLSFRSELKSLINSLHKQSDLDGLGDVSEETSSKSVLNRHMHRVGTDSNDRYVRGDWIRTEQIQNHQPADIGQIAIEQDQFRMW